MDSLRTMIPLDHHDIKILIYDQWNAAVRCDKLIIRMILIGGVLTVYEPEMGISLRRASCHKKSLARTFNPVEKLWISGCFPPFVEIEEALAKRSDVTRVGLPLSELKHQSIIGVINHLLGKDDIHKKMLSIWSKTGHNHPPVPPSLNIGNKRKRI